MTAWASEQMGERQEVPDTVSTGWTRGWGGPAHFGRDGVETAGGGKRGRRGRSGLFCRVGLG